MLVYAVIVSKISSLLQSRRSDVYGRKYLAFSSIVVEFWSLPVRKSSSVPRGYEDPSDGPTVSKSFRNVGWGSGQVIDSTRCVSAQCLQKLLRLNSPLISYVHIKYHDTDLTHTPYSVFTPCVIITVYITMILDYCVISNIVHYLGNKLWIWTLQHTWACLYGDSPLQNTHTHKTP